MSGRLTHPDRQANLHWESDDSVSWPKGSLDLAWMKCDLNGNECAWSAHFFRHLNLSEAPTQPTLEQFIAAFTPQHQERLRQSLRSLNAQNPSFRITARLSDIQSRNDILLINADLQTDTQSVHILIQPCPELPDQGLSLKQALAPYENLMDGAPDPMVLMSTEGEFLEGNIKARSLLSLSNDEFYRLNVEDIHPAAQLDDMMAFYQGVIWAQEERINTQVINRQGGLTPVEISGRLISAHSHKVIALTLRDMSEQLQAQQDLIRSEERYRSLVDEAREGMILLDDTGRILASNPKLSETTGYSASKLTRMTFDQIADFDMDISPIEIMHQSPDRLSIHTEGYLQTFTDELIPTGFNVARSGLHGQTQFIVTAYDLSQVRRGEEDRLQLQRQLFLTQKHELMGQLAGSLAHDFNNLLSPILLVSELLLEDAEDEFIQKQLGNINQAAVRARRLVGRILDYTRPEASEKVWIDLGVELNETLGLLRSSVPNTIEIVHTPMTAPAKCFADPDQIHQIIMNVGTNAAQAIGERPGVITFELDFLWVTEGDDTMLKNEVPEGPYLEIKVTDNGPGIPAQYLDQIFDPFFTTKPQTEGSGIGLSIVQQIAHNHDGFVSAENTCDGGACFKIVISAESPTR